MNAQTVLDRIHLKINEALENNARQMFAGVAEFSDYRYLVGERQAFDAVADLINKSLKELLKEELDDEE